MAIIKFADERLSLRGVIKLFMDLLPEVFLLHSTGWINKSFINGTLWFLSALLIVNFGCYPLIRILKNNWYMFSFFSFMFLYCLILRKNGNLDIWWSYSVAEYVTDGVIRAFAGCCLGGFIFGIKSSIGLDNYNRILSILSGILVLASIVLILYYPKGELREIYALIIFSGIIVCMDRANEGLSRIIFIWMDKLTFPMYMYQVVSIRIVQNHIANQWLSVWLVLILDLLFSLLSIFMTDRLRNKKTREIIR